MGRTASMSPLTALIALIWSVVSSYGKAASISRCHSVSAAKAWPRSSWRAA